MPVLLQNQWDIIPTSNKVNAKSQLFRAAWYNFIFPKTKTKKIKFILFATHSHFPHYIKQPTLSEMQDNATVFKVNHKGWWTEARPQTQM